MTNNQLTDKRTHELKIYPEFFSAVCTGAKRAELRLNDRDYRVGDVLHLFEYSKTTGRTGEYINVTVTHVADVSEWLAGCALVSFELQEHRKATPNHSGDTANMVEPVSNRDELPAKCWCQTCRPVTMNDMRFVVCPECGNKRCPRANDHRNVCTGSNAPGQDGSAYPAASKEGVMSKMTFIVEFEDGKEPPVHAHMEVFGGKVIAVAFRDVLEESEEADE